MPNKTINVTKPNTETEPTTHNDLLLKPTPEPAGNLAVKPATDFQEKPVKARSIEILETAAPTSMTRNEAMKYIKYLREENEKLNVKIRALEDNIKSAFAKADLTTKSTSAIEQAYIENLDYILSSMNNVRIAIENSAQVAINRVSSIKKGI